MKRICTNCFYFCYNPFFKVYESGSFCGLHGREFIKDPYHPPILDGKSSCGFVCKYKSIQLTFDFL